MHFKTLAMQFLSWGATVIIKEIYHVKFFVNLTISEAYSKELSEIRS